MKLIALALTCIAITLVATACTERAAAPNANAYRASGTPPGSPSPTASASVDELATARANYSKNCEACHGPEGTGGLVKVEKKQIKVASLKADHAIKHTDEQLAKMITNGEEEMPAFKDKLSQQEIAQMVRFIRKNFQGK
jgi:mono/diheme cytochrome c family protein